MGGAYKQRRAAKHNTGNPLAGGSSHRRSGRGQRKALRARPLRPPGSGTAWVSEGKSFPPSSDWQLCGAADSHCCCCCSGSNGDLEMTLFFSNLNANGLEVRSLSLSLSLSYLLAAQGERLPAESGAPSQLSVVEQQDCFSLGPSWLQANVQICGRV